MTAVDEMRTAIDTLERHKRELDVPPLIRWHDQESVPGWDGFIVIGDSAEEGDECNPVARVYTEPLAEMLICLHRTLDAQLTILRRQENRGSIASFNLVQVPYSDHGFWDAFALARAINGGAS